MSLFLLLLAQTAPAPSYDAAIKALKRAPAPAVSEKCENARISTVHGKDAAAPKLLAQEPAGELYRGVVHRVGGCEKPIKVRLPAK